MRKFILAFLISASSILHSQPYSTYLFPLGSIVTPDGIPKWNRLLNHKYKNNIFYIKLGKEVLATGFILSKESNYIITNAHVALTARGLGKLDELYAENTYGQMRIKDIIVVDKDLDFAMLRFEFIKEEADELNTINIYSGTAPNINDIVQIIGYVSREHDFVISNGIVIRTDYSRKRKPCFLYNADTDPGMSGSPVFNTKNELIGLHYGSPEQGQNNAIPFKIIVEKYKQYM